MRYSLLKWKRRNRETITEVVCAFSTSDWRDIAKVFQWKRRGRRKRGKPRMSCNDNIRSSLNVTILKDEVTLNIGVDKW